MGLESAGFKTSAFCEIDSEAQKVLRKNWPNTPIYEDITKLSAAQLADDGVPVEVICGGFPCQDLSTAGRGAGINGERSGLWYEYHRLIKELKPKYAIIENVSAIRSRGLEEVLRSLAAIRYDAEWHCIPAYSVGAPHQRDRWWAIAYPQCIGSQRQGQLITSVYPKEGAFGEASGLIHAFREGSLPYVCGRHDGVPYQSHRIKQLGNAVVPQIVEIIGKSIMNKESN